MQLCLAISDEGNANDVTAANADEDVAIVVQIVVVQRQQQYRRKSLGQTVQIISSM